MSDVVIDTNVAIWYFSTPVLPTQAAQTAIEAAATAGTIYVSAITVVELIYLIEKNRIPKDILSQLRIAMDDLSTAFQLAEIDRAVVDETENISRAIVPDLPDRVIAATALALELPLITSDSKIRSLSSIQTIW